MANHPYREAWALGSYPDIPYAAEQYFGLVVQSVDGITTRDLDRTKFVTLVTSGSVKFYEYDPTNVDAEDGVNVIWDSADRPFVLRREQTAASNAETQAGTDAEKFVTPAGLRSATRELLLANRTYYVRTDGSDSNNGLANTSGGAFLTIGKAIDVAYTLDWGIYRVTVQLGAGSFALTKSLAGPFLSNQSLLILGDTGTPSNVTITGTGNGLGLDSGAAVEISGCTLAPTGFCSVNVLPGGKFILGAACVFAGSPSLGWVYVAGGYATLPNAFTVTVSAAIVLRLDGGVIDARGAYTITLTGTPAFTRGFIEVYHNGVALISSKTFSGAATGPRYTVATGGSLFTNGGGASYFPGDASGSATSPGVYT